MIAVIAASGGGLAYFWRNREAFFYRQQLETQREKEKVLQESEAKLRFLSGQLMIVQEQERRRISKELHDELGQALMFLKFQLTRLSKEKRKTKNDFQSLLNYLDGVIEEVRRLSWDLSPACLEQFGLATAVKNLLEEFGQHFEIRWSPDEVKGIDHLFPPLAQVNIYRIFQECLTNIGRHAQATQISVNIEQQTNHVFFSVADNGKGFDLDEVWDRAGRERGIGLAAMQERARLAGGSLEIWSQPGAGTKISFTIPIDQGEQAMQPYRILLADDHLIFRETIKKSLMEIPGFKVVGEVSDGSELLEAIEQLSPQMIILDLGMPHLSGLEAATNVKRLHPEMKILVLTMYKSKDYIFRAFESKVDGYLLKENAFSDLLTAIDTIREGRMYISNLVTPIIQEIFSKQSWVAPQGSQPLSPREKEVLKYLAEGKSNREIAELLLISELTVRTHLGHIKKKLHMNSNVELARYALKQGYASLT